MQTGKLHIFFILRNCKYGITIGKENILYNMVRIKQYNVNSNNICDTKRIEYSKRY